MTTYLLDTTVIIDVLNDKKNRSLLLRDLVINGNVLACCPVNVAEVYAGLRPKEEAKTYALLRSFRYFPITFTVAQHAGLLRRDYSRKGITLSIADTLIAAVAIDNQLTLITDNITDFPMGELALYSLPDT